MTVLYPIPCYNLRDYTVYWLGQNFFISWITNPPTIIFRKLEEKKIISKKKIFYLLKE